MDLASVMKVAGVTQVSSFYEKFLGLFPVSLQWVVSLIVLVALVAAFYSLIRSNWIFLLLLVIVLPLAFPIFKNLFFGFYDFILYLVHQVATGMPANPLSKI